MIRTNPYYYSKFLFERVSAKEGIDYLDHYFEDKFGTKAFTLLNEWYYYNQDNALSTSSALDFEVQLDYIVNGSSQLPNASLAINYGAFFQELWQFSPTWDLFTMIRLNPTILNLHSNTEAVVINTLLDSFKKG